MRWCAWWTGWWAPRTVLAEWLPNLGTLFLLTPCWPGSRRKPRSKEGGETLWGKWSEWRTSLHMKSGQDSGVRKAITYWYLGVKGLAIRFFPSSAAISVWREGAGRGDGRESSFCGLRRAGVRADLAGGCNWGILRCPRRWCLCVGRGG